MQVLWPWWRIIKALCNHDRKQGHLSALHSRVSHTLHASSGQQESMAQLKVVREASSASSTATSESSINQVIFSSATCTVS